MASIGPGSHPVSPSTKELANTSDESKKEFTCDDVDHRPVRRPFTCALISCQGRLRSVHTIGVFEDIRLAVVVVVLPPIDTDSAIQR
jgi:hypothetical protein